MSESIRELESKLAKAKQEEINKKRKNKEELNDYCVGKCFKHVSHNWGTTFIKYENILGKMKYSDDGLVSEQVEVSFSTVGYVLEGKELKYLGPFKSARLPLKKHYSKGEVVQPAAKYHHSYFTPKSKNSDHDGNVYVSNEYHTYLECSVDEFNDVREIVLEQNKEAKKTFEKYVGIQKGYYANNVLEVTVTDRKLLEDLLKKVQEGKVSLNDIVPFAKSKLEFYPYQNNQLTYFEQRKQEGDKTGMNLSIDSGDDGTDYEPYVTRYILRAINIDWKRVLYLIRHKLDSVIKTAEDLEKLTSVYNSDNWDLNWFGSYDVSFDGATLNKNILKEINGVIKKHLK